MCLFFVLWLTTSISDVRLNYGRRHAAELLLTPACHLMSCLLYGCDARHGVTFSPLAQLHVHVKRLQCMCTVFLTKYIWRQSPDDVTIFVTCTIVSGVFLLTEKRLSQKNEMSYGVRNNNVYFESRPGGGGGIEDDHIPFLRKSKL